MKLQVLTSYVVCIALAALLGTPCLWAQTTSPRISGYSQPQKAILDVMRAPSPPYPVPSPSNNWMMLVSFDDYPPITRVATPYLRLGGVRIEPGNHSKHDSRGGYGIPPAVRGYELAHLPDGRLTNIKLPVDGYISKPYWSADGHRFAFERVTADSVELWVGSTKNGEVHQVPGVWLNQMLGDELQWMPDQKSLLVKLVPQKLAAPPPTPELFMGPNVQESIGSTGQSSTYEARDTLNNSHDEDLFDYYGTSQVALVDATTGKITRLGSLDRHLLLSPSPDGQHVLVSTIHKPYSHVTTFDRFPKMVEVWDITNSSHITRHTIADLPLADRVPIHGVPLGPRSFIWNPKTPASLLWAEALDGGDWSVTTPRRDKIMTLSVPFTAAPEELLGTEQRFSSLIWSEQPGVALLSEYDSNRHWTRTYIYNPENWKQPPRLLWDLSEDDQYVDPGEPVLKVLSNGVPVIRQEGDIIYLSGKGASPDGDRPFLDRLNLRTLMTERLWRCGKTEFEEFLTFPGSDSKTFLSWHQSLLEPPNAFIRTLGKGVKADKGEGVFESCRQAITQYTDPVPEVRKIKKQLVKYKRADGLDLSFTLYTPPEYKEGTRIPTILYAYPLDYADSAAAGQVTGSQYTFTRLRNYRLLLLAGYAIIDNASFPIVGDPKKAYDTYLEQLVADAKAAVDKSVEIGVADPNRIGVTGIVTGR